MEFARQKSAFLFAVILALLTQGCVTLFKPQVQKDVELKTENEDPDTRITVMNKGDTGVASYTVDLKRDHSSHQAVLMKEGYKNAYRAVYSDKFGAGTVVCLVLDAPLFATILLAGVEVDKETQKKYWNYRDPYYLEPPQVKIPEKESGQKYLVHRSTSIDLDKDDTTIIEYEDPEAFEEGEEPEDVTLRSDSLTGEEVFVDADINDLLVRIGYQDTGNPDEDIVLNDYNSVQLNSEIDRYTIRRFGKRGNYFQVDIGVKWEFTDNYGEPLYDTSITTRSGEFSRDYEAYDFYEEGDNYEETRENIKHAEYRRFQLAIRDALQRSLIELVKGEKVTELLEKGALEEEKKELDDLEPIDIEKAPPPESDNMNEQINGVVTIQKDQNSHGSGCIISKDGYILTNYHVVAGADSLDILFDRNTKKVGVLERKSKVLDLALLKVDTSGLNPLRIKNSKDINIGSDVMAIGTPKNVQLGQSVTKGIISGKREFNKVDYIQTDVSINAGNSGGALIDKNSGTMIGVVTAKMFGFGVEGVGFAVPAYKALEKLNIDYE